MTGGEDRLVAWLRARLGGDDLLGDDTARLRVDGELAVTVDQQIEGVHFPPGLDAATVARRLLAVNLSDLAAAGATPRWALSTVAAPASFDHKAFFRALVTACRGHGVVLAGGDLAASATLGLSLTLLGGRARGAAPLGRDRASAGHDLWLGGTVGESALGGELLVRGARWRRGRADLPEALGLPAALLPAARRAVARHLLPRPQLELGGRLARLRAAGATIDLSDGLAKDLRRLCAASGVGATLDLPSLRRALSPRFERLCDALDLSPLGLALGGGEDYVLLFTLPAGRTPPGADRCVRIGAIERSRRIWMRDAEGRRSPLPELGWDHLARA
ncbi:MAG: thiamine-phosphate kinase [Holophagales bacterium]|nr:thiamine-phosphate kinase [Holophagales bacterium]